MTFASSLWLENAALLPTWPTLKNAHYCIQTFGTKTQVLCAAEN